MPLPKIHLPDSIKKWQSTYFYVKNLIDVDQIGLPAFSDTPPEHKSWNRKPLADSGLEGGPDGPAEGVGGRRLDIPGPDLGMAVKADVSAADSVAQNVLLLRAEGPHSSQHRDVAVEQLALVGRPHHHRQN